MKVYLTITLILICTSFAFAQPGKKVIDPAAPTPKEVNALQTSDREKALELYRQGNFKAAIPLLERVVAENRTDQRAGLYLGMSLAKTDRMSESIKVLKRSLASAPAEFPLHDYL